MTHLEALVRATSAALTGGANLWGDRVYKDLAQNVHSGQPVIRPYVVCNLQAGGNRGGVRDFVSLNWQVRAVAEAQQLAYTCADRIIALLHNADRGSAKQLQSFGGWHILAVTQNTTIDILELLDGVRIFHAGAVFRVLMEAEARN